MGVRGYLEFVVNGGEDVNASRMETRSMQYDALKSGSYRSGIHKVKPCHKLTTGVLDGPSGNQTAYL